jgi:hypothetical protein
MSEMLDELEAIDFGINVETDLAEQVYDAMMSEVPPEANLIE